MEQSNVPNAVAMTGPYFCIPIKYLFHPEEGILVIGEAVSLNQGWTHGAIESSKKAVTKSWINKMC